MIFKLQTEKEPEEVFPIKTVMTRFGMLQVYRSGSDYLVECQMFGKLREQFKTEITDKVYKALALKPPKSDTKKTKLRIGRKKPSDDRDDEQAGTGGSKASNQPNPSGSR